MIVLVRCRLSEDINGEEKTAMTSMQIYMQEDNYGIMKTN